MTAEGQMTMNDGAQHLMTAEGQMTMNDGAPQSGVNSAPNDGPTGPTDVRSANDNLPSLSLLAVEVFILFLALFLLFYSISFLCIYKVFH